MLNLNYMQSLTWRCQICHNIRPDNKISVISTDLTEALELNDMGKDVVRINTRYCNDKDKCRQGAIKYNKDEEERVKK